MKKFTLLNGICAATVATSALVPTSVVAASEARYSKIAKSIEIDVLDEFYRLCFVPRKSFYTRQICDYLTKRFQQFGIPQENIHEDAYRSNWVDGVEVDPEESSGNLWIDIPANDGKSKDRKPFVLQAHMDMAWATVEDYDGPKFPIPILEETKDGRIIHTMDYQTSLGADDGVGLALLLAIAKSTKYKHGPLRFIITADEEEGMCGAKYIGCREKPKSEEEFLKNREPVFDNVKYLLNIDGEKEGEITTSTAGADIAYYTMQGATEELLETQELYYVDVTGLLGGHSGMDIGDGRGNALKVLAEVLGTISKTHDGYKKIVGISATSAGVNAIPNVAKVILALEDSPAAKDWKDEISKINDQIRAKYAAKDPDIKVTGGGVSVEPRLTTCYTEVQTKAILDLINKLHYGVQEWLPSGAIETSCNIGPLEAGWVWKVDPDTNEGAYKNMPFSLGVGSRSCINQKIVDIANYYQLVYNETIGQQHEKEWDSGYDLQNQFWGWAGDEDKHLFNTIRRSYESIGIKWNKIDAHAGLEISWFQYIEPSILMSAVGPTLDNCHTPEEVFYVDTYNSVINAVIRSIDKLQK